MNFCTSISVFAYVSIIISLNFYFINNNTLFITVITNLVKVAHDLQYLHFDGLILPFLIN